MGELKLSARLRMMAKGAFTRGDVISADRLSRAAIEHDSLVDQLATAKAEIAELKSDMKFMCTMYQYQGFTTSQYNKMVLILAKHKGE